MRYLLVSIVLMISASLHAQPVVPEKQNPKQRVVVAFLPDREPSYWRGGVPFRLNRTIFPVADTTTRLEWPGFDLAKIVLENFVSAFSEAHPQITFIPVYELSEQLSPERGPGHVGYGNSRYSALFKAQLEANNAASGLLLVAIGPGDSDRPNPYGGFGIMTTGIRDGDMVPTFKRWRASINLGVDLVAFDSDLRFAGIGGILLRTAGVVYDKHRQGGYRNLMPWFEGTESEILELFSGPRQNEILDVFQKEVAVSARLAQFRSNEYLRYSRETSPFHWTQTLPYLPPFVPSSRTGDPSQ